VEGSREIAPISFQDSSGDGKGDLKGIESRIDYLQWPGIDAVFRHTDAGLRLRHRGLLRRRSRGTWSADEFNGL